MQRRLLWALVATLVGVTFAANGAVVASAAAQAMEQQSRPDPPPAPGFRDLLPWFAAAGAAIGSLGLAMAAHAWAKLRAGTRQPAPVQEEEERPLAPPGLAGPVARTRRAGAAPLVGFTLAGLAIAALGGTLGYLALATLVQTMGMEGRAHDDAVLWARVLRFAAYPCLALGGVFLGAGWGRWFPLGPAAAAPRAAAPRLSALWQRQL